MTERERKLKRSGDQGRINENYPGSLQMKLIVSATVDTCRPKRQSQGTGVSCDLQMVTCCGHSRHQRTEPIP